MTERKGIGLELSQVAGDLGDVRSCLGMTGHSSRTMLIIAYQPEKRVESTLRPSGYSLRIQSELPPYACNAGYSLNSGDADSTAPLKTHSIGLAVAENQTKPSAAAGSTSDRSLMLFNALALSESSATPQRKPGKSAP